MSFSFFTFWQKVIFIHIIASGKYSPLLYQRRKTMAIFSNQATLTYNGNSTSSNIAYGEILDILTVTKNAVEGNYTPGSTITYAISLRNTGSTPLNSLTVTDDLGGYVFGANTVYPLSYVSDSVLLFIDGVPQAAPAVTPSQPLVISGINIPAGADAVLIYQAEVSSFAAPFEGGVIENTVSISGSGITGAITASATVPAATEPFLTISKSISPSQVVDNDRVTYTFIIENSGNRAIVATDNAAINDTFDPILSDLVVSFDGITWTEGTQYNYDEATGLFTTVPGQILVPAASYVQDPITGAYTVNPGIATLTVTGTI